VLAAVVALGALLLTAAPALAASVTDRPLLFSFNGSDTTAGTIGEMRGGLAVDEASGSVYALDLNKNVIDKFDASGAAANFSATGTSSLDGGETPDGEFKFNSTFNSDARIAVDDSPVNTDRLYVANSTAHPYVDAFAASGAFLWRLPLASNACGVAVDTEGHLWLGDQSAGRIREYANTGSPPAEVGSFAATLGPPCSLDVAKDGAVYAVGGETLRKYVGGVLSSTVDTGVRGVAVDQSSLTGHVFSLHRDNFGSGDFFKEFDSSETLVGSFGLGLLYESQGIAYNPSLDRVYVGQFVGPDSEVSTGTIKALGPIATGTTPDPTAEAASEIEISKAKLNGKVNPQSVPNAYFFEWTQGTATFNWRQAKSSPPQSLAEDSTEHTVSLNLTGLEGHTTYQARLVGLNTTSGLRSVSSSLTFTTATPSAPAATIDPVSGVTSSTASVSGTVNPEGDFGTSWRLQLSTDPACASGFENGAAHNLESEASSPQAVAEELTGLLPNQHYCVRIAATNGGGTTNSSVEEFTTDPVAPTLAETAFAAPRTDSSARLNGRVNPQGADAAHPLTYRFEWSEDGGATWTALPDQQYSGGAREQIVVGEELDGLDPSTPYSYRFSVESDAGPASPQGGVKTFTTRSTAEMTPPKRGYELVNNSEKGTQNVLSGVSSSLPGLSVNGERAIWSVSAGAPGAPNGVTSSFLAERTPSGWQSRSIAPPAEEQVGEGKRYYVGRAATADFSHFVFDAEYKPFFSEASEATLVRLDDSQNQDVLQSYSWSEEHEGPGAVDMTDDSAHIVDVNHTTDQLEEIGDGSGEVLSIMPDGTPSSCGLQEGPSFVGGNKSLRGAGNLYHAGYHGISTTDASRVYFEAKPNGECANSWGLYVRNRESEETTLIDPGTATHDAGFITTTPNGRQAYFATLSQLDPADANEDADVYRWDEQSEESSCLTCVVADASLETSSAIGGSFKYEPVLISKDFSHIYFESREELVPGHPLEGSLRNLYVLSEGEIRFVAKDDKGLGVLREGVLSDDGNALAFIEKPHPYLTADEIEGEPEVLYLYEDAEESLECVSCARVGTTAHTVNSGFSFAFQLSADGSTISFVTADALTPLDVNGSSDVYAWRDGALQLITDGVTEFPVGEFSKPLVQGIDADGSNILFSVTDPGLTGYEVDRLANLYDARIDGGFERPSPVVHCEGESCQGPLEAPPAVTRSASSAFSGAGNLAPKAKKRQRPCAHKRGKARQRCVRKHKRDRKHKHSSGAGARADAGRAK